MKSILLVIAGVAILLAPRIQTTGDPGAGYTWSLGDLAADSSRLETNWNLSEWADSYDTEAELNALGWTTVPVHAEDCAATGSNEDQTVITDAFTANCSGGTCNNVFKLDASCQYDMLAYTNDGIDGTPALYLPYSNFAIIGGGDDSTYIALNNTVANNTSVVSMAFANSASWGNAGGSNGSTYTWSSGGTKDDATLTLASCSGLDSDDLIQILGTDEDGAALQYDTRTTDVSGTGPCTVTLADPFPTTFTGRTSVQELASGRTRKMIFKDFQMGFPLLPAGTCTGTDGGSLKRCAVGFRLHGAEEVLFDSVRWGPYGNNGFDIRYAYRVVIRNSRIGPNLWTQRRGNNGSAMGGNPYGSFLSVYNNIFDTGAIRVTISTEAAGFSYYGFNYWVTQSGINGDTGNYCSGVTIGSGFPWLGGGPERGLFINHDSYDPPVDNVGRWLFENNDVDCQVLDEGANTGRRYGTLYRNRVTRNNPSLTITDNARQHPYYNFYGNRFSTYSFGSNTPNATGRYNIASTTMATPGGSGVTWPASGEAGENVVDAGEHDDSATANLPPSLAFLQNNAPNWWCTQSGTWAALGDDDTAFSFGYADGYLGTTHKLPAQIRYEGTTCTPP